MTDIVITGASGLLGRALMHEFVADSPVGTALHRVTDSLVKLDLCDGNAVDSFLGVHKPRVIIHAAAERRPDVSERDHDRTRALNELATQHLAHRAQELGAWVLYLSTDYVFDGASPPYAPGAATHPLNFYGQSKLDGEMAVRAELPDAAILRVGVLFGAVEYIEESAVTTLLKDVMHHEPVAVDDWGQRYPTYVDDLAVVCRQMTKQHLIGQGGSGIWHWCGSERLTKYSQAVSMGEALGLPTSHLQPQSDQPAGAPRPHDCQLDCSALEQRGIGQRTPFQEAIERSLRGFVTAG